MLLAYNQLSHKSTVLMPYNPIETIFFQKVALFPNFYFPAKKHLLNPHSGFKRCSHFPCKSLPQYRTAFQVYIPCVIIRFPVKCLLCLGFNAVSREFPFCHSSALQHFPFHIFAHKPSGSLLIKKFHNRFPLLYTICTKNK